MNFLRVLLFLLCASAMSPAHAETVRVAFWNVEWFPGGRPNAYRGEQINQIRAVHADIVKLDAHIIGLEEVRDWDNAGLAVKPLPGFKVDVISNFPPREDQTETQQVAIVSRLQPMSAWSELWKANGAVLPPRGFAFAAYELAPRQLLLVYALHLKSNRGELLENIAIREESMRQLYDHMQAMAKAYGPLGAITWIVGGDLNTAPDDPRFAKEKTIPFLLEKGFRWSWEGMPLSQRTTLPPSQGFPAACFDHILYRGATMRKAEVVATSEKSSDHRAIRAEFTLP
ncbi:MAG TPA: endonuclease/exonuclease/phosphatase family protein [Chthoniobacterales bacterium]|nr:endonuclease/exonuclease/phosphatase family protein [Chthoniobacterales bacterium]